MTSYQQDESIGGWVLGNWLDMVWYIKYHRTPFCL